MWEWVNDWWLNWKKMYTLIYLVVNGTEPRCCDYTLACFVLKVKVKVKSLFATPWTVAYQASLSMGFSRQEYWSGWPFPSPGDLPNPGIEPGSPSLQADALPSEPPGMLKTGNSFSQLGFFSCQQIAFQRQQFSSHVHVCVFLDPATNVCYHLDPLCLQIQWGTELSFSCSVPPKSEHILHLQASYLNLLFGKRVWMMD